MSEHTQDELPPIIDEEQYQDCQEFNTDHDLEPPEDDILEFITSQEHSDDQLDQAFMLLPNHMKVKMYLTLSTHHPILKRSCLRQNKFSCFLYWINSC